MNNTTRLTTLLLLICIAGKSQPLQDIKDTLDKWIEYDGAYDKALALSLQTEERLRLDSGEHNINYAEFVHSYVGSAYEYAGDLKSAEYFYKKGMKLCAAIAGNKSFSYAEACANLGNLYNRTGLLNEAIQYLNTAYEILSIAPDAPESSLSPTMNNLAEAYMYADRYGEAIKIYSNLLKIMLADTNYKPYLPIVYSNLGTIYLNIAAFNKAQLYYNKAYTAMSDFYSPQSTRYIGIKSNFALIKAYTGQSKKAIEMLSSLDTTLQNFSISNPALHINILNKLAIAFYADKKYADAKQTLLRAVDTAVKNQLLNIPYTKGSYLLLANVHIDEGNYNAAEKILLADVDSTRLINKKLYFGYLLALERLYAATKKINKAELYIQRLNEAATKIYDNNFYLLSNNERLGLLPVLQNALYSEIDIMLQKPVMSNEEKNSLFNHCIAMKSRLLQDQRTMMNELHLSNNDTVRNIYVKWINNRRYLDKQFYQPESQRSPFTDSIRIETEAAESELMQLLKLQPEKFSQLQQFGIKEVQANLTINDAVVQFIKCRAIMPGKHAYKDEYIAMIVNKEDSVPAIIKLCSENDLLAVLPGINTTTNSNNYLNKLYVDSRLRNKNHSYPGDKLYALLIKPLLPFLKNKHTLYCSTDGLINIIALHALPVNANKMVIDNYNIRYTSGSAQLVSSEEAISNMSEAAVWGGINYDAGNKNMPAKNKPNWKVLPASKIEAVTISSLLNNNNIHTLLYTGDSASKTEFDALSGRRLDIVHISTHGYFISSPEKEKYTLPFYVLVNDVNENNMLDCGLVLAGANNYAGFETPDTGYIDAYEISAMDFSGAHLVTLSACETAVGKNVNGEGLFGLSRAFALAGAKNILVSLWQVPDKETTEFMILFYKLWLQGMPMFDAFEKTQKAMKEKYPPYYWAAFKLIKE